MLLVTKQIDDNMHLQSQVMVYYDDRFCRRHRLLLWLISYRAVVEKISKIRAENRKKIDDCGGSSDDVALYLST